MGTPARREHKTDHGRAYQSDPWGTVVLIEWTPRAPIAGFGRLTCGRTEDHPTEGLVVAFAEVATVGGRKCKVSIRVTPERGSLRELVEAARAIESELVAAREAADRAEEERRQRERIRVVRWGESNQIALTWVAPAGGRYRDDIAVPVGPDTILCVAHPCDWPSQLPTLGALWDSSPHYAFLGGGSPGLAAITPEQEAALVAEAALMRARQGAAARERREGEARRLEVLRSEPVPADAVAAYQEYGGDADRAWNEENETAWSLVSRYAEAIEEQGLAVDVAGRKFARESQAAAREAHVPGED